MDEKVADSLIDMLHSQDRSDSVEVARILWRGAETFKSRSGRDEFAFMDLVLRLYAGVLMKLEPVATRQYFEALIERIDPALEPKHQAWSELERAEAWRRLRKALIKAGESGQGLAS